MGKPKLNQSNTWHNEAKKLVHELLAKNPQGPKLEGLHTCELSNQHIILFVDRLDKNTRKNW